MLNIRTKINVFSNLSFNKPNLTKMKQFSQKEYIFHREVYLCIPRLKNENYIVSLRANFVKLMQSF